MTRMPLCEKLKFKVDHVKLAEGMFDMFDENEKGVLQFGMLPAKKMQLLEANLGDKIMKALKADHIKQELEPLWEDYKFTPKQVVDEIMHAVSVHIYSIGNLVV